MDLNKTTLRNKFNNGQIILINKPIGKTSFEIVKHIRFFLMKYLKLNKLKVGHAGTLDPLATGLLILCTGKMTKKIESIQNQYKEYTGIITLGSTTPSFDLETEFDSLYDYSHVDEKLIQSIKKKFLGKVDQFPPVFSALKKNGKRLYEYARKGEKINIKSRKIEILEFDIKKISLPNIYFRIKCSKGTYIRSIANDFGKSLNSGAHLSKLSRTKIGDYNISQSIKIEDFKDFYLSTSYDSFKIT